MKKLTVYFLLAVTVLISSCKSGDRGELVGVRSTKKFYPEKPLGMTIIPGGSFTMGKSDEDVVGAFNSPTRTVTVNPFYMDETEITNSEYREFVVRVRDSVLRTQLALLAEEQGFGAESADLSAGAQDPGNGDSDGIQKYAFRKPSDTANVYYKYMMDNYGSLGDLNSPTEGRALNWDVDLVWDVNQYPNEYYAEAMDSLYAPISESFDGRRTVNTKKLKYLYFTFNREAAARKRGGNRKDFIKENVVEVYPDTTVWVKDFNYSYNDPMHQDYFWHQAYNDYPVVGVTWAQAKAFCDFRTQKKNKHLATKKKGGGRIPSFRLPTEAEWEYAARGGLEYAKYPWGGPYTYSDRGCFLANFKPERGDYAVDGALYTMEAKSFAPNDYGLYNMAGNVSEWTNTAYNPSSYYLGSTMNPNVNDDTNQRKVIRGGSWKDVAYFLEVATRDYEYSDSARSYIGFRTVQDYLGTKTNDKK